MAWMNRTGLWPKVVMSHLPVNEPNRTQDFVFHQMRESHVNLRRMIGRKVILVCACEFGAVFVLTCPVLGTGRFYCGQENGLTANSKPLAVVPRIG
jgi:hypothetical protein